MVIEHREFRERGYSGGFAERDMFGSPFQILSGGDIAFERQRIASFKSDLRLLVARHGDERTGYLPFDTALRFSREHQADKNPHFPSKPFLQELFKQLTDVLTEHFAIEDLELDDLRFFSSVDTPLDIFHGIDGWIEIKNPHTQEFVRVTLDVTQNSGKMLDGHKADVIVPAIQHYPIPPNGTRPSSEDVARYRKQKKAYEAQVREVAEKIVHFAFVEERRVA